MIQYSNKSKEIKYKVQLKKTIFTGIRNTDLEKKHKGGISHRIKKAGS